MYSKWSFALQSVAVDAKQPCLLVTLSSPAKDSKSEVVEVAMEETTFDTEPVKFPSGSATLLAQGAEARVFLRQWLGQKVVVKERFEKKYRHPALDTQLRKDRLRNEVRALDKCRRAGIPVPTPLFLDTHRIVMSYIEDSQPVRVFVSALQKEHPSEETYLPLLTPLARQLGASIANIHKVGLIHGDLTTSNVLMRVDADVKGGVGEGEDAGLVWIDFGLSSGSTSAEDRGVDLYVLEKAFVSTHPDTEKVFAEILTGYKDEFGKGGDAVLRKLEESRQRGRKRDMTG